MTERSFLVDGTTTGDAVLAPYNDAQFQEMMRALFLPVNARYGIAPGSYTKTGSGLTVEIIDATTVRVYQGTAIVFGVAYLVDQEDITVSRPTSGYYYHVLVLRCDLTAQTARLVLIGPGTSTYPAITQSALVWDIVLCRLISISSGVSSIILPAHNEMIAPNHFHLLSHIWRQGGSANDWDSPGTNDYKMGLGIKIQFGVIEWTGSDHTGSIVVTFPHEYASGYNPIVFLTARSKYLVTAIIRCDIADLSESEFTAAWSTDPTEVQTSVDINWMAIGYIPEF